MKYLIKHKKEFAIAIGAVVMTAVNLARAIKSGDISEDIIIAFVLAVFTLLGLYYNMPTSKQNSMHTDEMRVEKEMEKNLGKTVEYVEEPEDSEATDDK